MMEPKGDDWHVQIVSLVRSCLGQITDNVRLISLIYLGNRWRIRFVLETDTESDRAIIDEIFEDFEVESWNTISAWRTQGSVDFSPAIDLGVDMEVVISADEIKYEQTEQVFWLYRRRERHSPS